MDGWIGNQEGLERMRFCEVMKAENGDVADANCGAGVGSEVECGR